MKLDRLENRLICEQFDFQESLGYLRESRIVPEDIEACVLKLVLKKLGVAFADEESVEDLLQRLPEGFVHNCVTQVNGAYSRPGKIDYAGFHLPYLLYPMFRMSGHDVSYFSKAELLPVLGNNRHRQGLKVDIHRIKPSPFNHL